MNRTLERRVIKLERRFYEPDDDIFSDMPRSPADRLTDLVMWFRSRDASPAADNADPLDVEVMEILDQSFEIELAEATQSDDAELRLVATSIAERRCLPPGYPTQEMVETHRVRSRITSACLDGYNDQQLTRMMQRRLPRARALLEQHQTEAR